jgi:hypothetical protein
MELELDMEMGLERAMVIFDKRIWIKIENTSIKALPFDIENRVLGSGFGDGSGRGDGYGYGDGHEGYKKNYKHGNGRGYGSGTGAG